MNHNWEYKPFNLIAGTITPRMKLEKTAYLQNGIIPVISQEESFISGYWNNPDDITPHSTDVVIFGDHSRVVKYVDCDFVVGADGVKIITPKKCISAKFLYHFLKWYDIPSLGYARHFKLVKEAIYPIPPMEVQQQIVAEFDKINEVIEDCRELLRNLDTLAQTLFYYFFGDPVTNSKGWQTQTLSEIAPQHPYKGKFSVDDDIWLLNLDMIEKNTGRIISRHKVKYVDIGNSVYKIGPKQVLYSKLRPNLNKVVIADDFGYCTSELLPLNPQKVFLNCQYLAYLLRTKECVTLFSGKVAGAKMPRTDMKVFRNVQIPIPPLSLQEQFAERIEQIEEQKKAVEATIAEMQTLLDSRKDYWFN